MAYLKPCPDSPNCVCSEASDAAHRIEPFRFTGDPQAAWVQLHEALRTLPRLRIVTLSDDYLHAEVRTRLLRFVDDLEFLLAPAEGCIHVRSASRVGYSDLGANRRRVESLRRLLDKVRGA